MVPPSNERSKTSRGSAKHRSGKPEQGSQQGNQQGNDTPVDNDVHGEGNYSASRRFNEAERTFVESGRGAEGGRDAAPQSDAEALEMDAAEREARSKAKEEDPALTRPWPTSSKDAAKDRDRRRK